MSLAPSAHAQLENRVWIMGAGTGGNAPVRLDFGFGAVPTSPVASDVPNTSVEGIKAMAVLTDPLTGKLICYSDGKAIYDSTNTVIPNGGGLPGLIDYRTAVFVAQPDCTLDTFLLVHGSTGQAYATAPNASGPLYYTKVATPGGLHVPAGQKKKIFPSPPGYTTMPPVCTSFEIIPRQGTKDYWLVTRKYMGDEYYVYLIHHNGTGLSITHHQTVIDSGGDTYHFGSRWNRRDGAMGQIGFVESGLSYGPGAGSVYVMDFNTATGTLSNRVTLDDEPYTSSGYSYVNDFEWSPDNTKIYYCHWGYQVLYQYDLTTGLRHTIQSFPSLYDQGNVKLGPDGYIYHIPHSDLSSFARIETPNLAADDTAFVYNPSIASTPGSHWGYGLPNTSVQMLTSNRVVGIDTQYCDRARIGLANPGIAASADWYYNGVYMDSANLHGSAAWVYNPGLYAAMVTDTAGCRSIAASYIVPLMSHNADTVQAIDTLGCTQAWIGIADTARLASVDWYFNGSYMDSANLHGASIHVYQTGYYSAIFTDTVGCHMGANGIDVHLMPANFSLPDASICPGTSVTLTASGFSSYQWSPAAGLSSTTGASIVASPMVTTQYMLVGSMAAGCADTAYFTVAVLAGPGLSAFAFPASGPAPLHVSFTANSAVGSWVDWDYADGDTDTGAAAWHTYGDTGTYVIVAHVLDANGCEDTVHVTVSVLADTAGAEDSSALLTMAIPNAFSPGNDGVNDAWFIASSGLSSFHVYIYNSSGHQVFESADPTFQWDGTQNGEILAPGTYFYRILAEHIDGGESQKKSYRGPISLVR